MSKLTEGQEMLAMQFGIKTGVDHSRCHLECRGYVICPSCKVDTFIWVTHGRWDEEEGHTAMPFDPVAVTLGCRCVIGDYAAAGHTA